ncbi:zinc finger (CCCH type) motif-containing protein [Toxoplasma gondii RUB]|uniref:Zinc finger (CCCH type) motif-containing protein n=1 Tax=Toxoplasma gondii RUB TaxID=935652 RepID=A0A086LQF4_TOXGO|nr:zinc finger (CCCH type) motif-containing protein [Toxoplasma gondii RUB]
MALPPTLDDENLYKFRTKICERYVKQGRCEFADRCQYSHDLRWTRRPPWKYNYCPELCHDLQFVKDGRGRTIAKSSCKQKRNCKFAHTKEEQVYHPKMYKTIMCKQFQTNAWCDRYYCPFAHTLSELRPADLFYPPSKVVGSCDDQDALCPDIYLPSDKPHPRLRARFLAIMDSVGPGRAHHFGSTTESLANSNRTRHAYSDFISSHTPQSVLSDTRSPSNSARADSGTPPTLETTRVKNSGESRVQRQEQSLSYSAADASTSAHAQEQKRSGESAVEQKEQELQHERKDSGGVAVPDFRKSGARLQGSGPLKHPGQRTVIKDNHMSITIKSGGSILGNPGNPIPRRPRHGTNCPIPQLTTSPRVYTGKQSSQDCASNSAALEKEANRGGGSGGSLHTERLPLLPTSAVSTISDVARSPHAATPYVISSALQSKMMVEGSHTSYLQQGCQEHEKGCIHLERHVVTPPGLLPQSTIFGSDCCCSMVVPSVGMVPQPVREFLDHNSEHVTQEKMITTASVHSLAEPLDRCSFKCNVLPGDCDDQEALRRRACIERITSRTPAFSLSSQQSQFGGLKQLADDIYFWSEPLGQCRDDPSVLVFPGVVLGPNKQLRERVAIKQVPVVVTSRMRDSFAELEQFVHVHDPLIVNTKGVYCMHNDDDEGMSLMFVLEKCDGCLSDLIAVSDLGERCLQEPLPPQGMTEMLSHLLSGVLKIQQYGHSAHMRIHPGNIMLTQNFELKVGDCAGKIRYLSIFDLLHAGVQGARNARELIHWILNSPQEAAWLAPEFIRSLIHIAQQISVLIHQYEALPPESRKNVRFSVLADNMKWPSSFLQKADAWSTGATLFYIVSGGIHPYGDTSDRSIITHILEDRKVNLEKIRESPLLHDLVEGLLASDPDKRTSLSQALCHAAFWKMGETEHFLRAFQASVEANPESCMVLALSDPISWISSLASAASPLFSLLVSYLTSPSCLSLLISSLRVENSVSFLLFLALLSADSRLPEQERRSLVSSAILLHPSAFLKAVRLLLFTRIPENPAEFVISRNSTYVKQYLGDGSGDAEPACKRAAVGISLFGAPQSETVAEGMKHAVRHTSGEGQQGLLGALPSGSRPASAPAFVSMHRMGFPASAAPVTASEGSFECYVPSETHHSQTEDCQRPPPPPPAVSAHVLPPQEFTHVQSISTDCAGIPSHFTRCSNHPHRVPSPSSLTGERPVNCCVPSRNLVPTMGSCVEPKQVHPTMIPQVRALMNAARAMMQPTDQAKIRATQEMNVTAALPVGKKDACNWLQQVKPQSVSDQSATISLAGTSDGLALAVQHSKVPVDLDQQTTELQTLQSQTASVKNRSVHEAGMNRTSAGLSWRLSASEYGGQNSQERSGDGMRKGSEVLKDDSKHTKRGSGSAPKASSRGVKSAPKPVVARSDRNSGPCQNATGKQTSNDEKLADSKGLPICASKRVTVVEPRQRPNPAANTKPEPPQDFRGTLKRETDDNANQSDVFASRQGHREGTSSDQVSSESAKGMSSPQGSAHDFEGGVRGTAVIPPSSSSALSSAPDACFVQQNDMAHVNDITQLLGTPN